MQVSYAFTGCQVRWLTTCPASKPLTSAATYWLSDMTRAVGVSGPVDKLVCLSWHPWNWNWRLILKAIDVGFVWNSGVQLSW
jgi:hypothetical protein